MAKTQINTKEEFDALRKELRKELFNQAALDLALKGEPVETISLTFSGYGDSGSWHDTLPDARVMSLFDYVLGNHVNFDWYNNEGGGGEITWDLANDKFIASGYQNITIEEDVDLDYLNIKLNPHLPDLADELAAAAASE